MSESGQTTHEAVCSHDDLYQTDVRTYPAVAPTQLEHNASLSNNSTASYGTLPYFTSGRSPL